MAISGRLARWSAAVGIAVAGALSVAVSPLAAQGYFGQNQVQYDRLRWRVIETEHFLVHYYPGIADVAPDAARMAERSYARLSRLMAHQFREKKPILVFGSSGDFAQSNVFGDLGEGTGGVTDPLRQRRRRDQPGVRQQIILREADRNLTYVMRCSHLSDALFVPLPVSPSQDQSSTHEGHLHVHGTPNTLIDPWIPG